MRAACVGYIHKAAGQRVASQQCRKPPSHDSDDRYQNHNFHLESSFK